MASCTSEGHRRRYSRLDPTQTNGRMTISMSSLAVASSQLKVDVVPDRRTSPGHAGRVVQRQDRPVADGNVPAARPRWHHEVIPSDEGDLAHCANRQSTTCRHDLCPSAW